MSKDSIPVITGTLPAGGKGVAVGQHAEVRENLDPHSALGCDSPTANTKQSLSMDAHNIRFDALLL